MAKFIVVNMDECNGDVFDTYDLALENAQEQASSLPDTEFYVAELKAKVVAELKIDVTLDESKFNLEEEIPT
jgi:hypothetical protein